MKTYLAIIQTSATKFEVKSFVVDSVKQAYQQAGEIGVTVDMVPWTPANQIAVTNNTIRLNKGCSVTID